MTQVWRPIIFKLLLALEIMNKRIKKLVNKPASAMLIVIFVLAGIFIVAFGTSYRVFFSIKAGDIQSQSLKANYALQVGEEQVRYETNIYNLATSSCPGTNIFGTTTLSNQTYYNVDCLSTSSPYLMRVYGNFKNIQRYHDAYYTIFDCGNELVEHEGGPYDEDGVSTTTGGFYRTVLVGSQCWLKNNLNVGAMVTGTTTDQTDNSILEKYCYDDNLANCTSDGGLYQWNEAMQYSAVGGAQGICPEGWHIPTDAEQNTLDQYLNDTTCDASRNDWDCDAAGTKLMPGGTSGFTGLLTGTRDTDGSFVGQSLTAFFWSSSVSATDAWARYLTGSYSTVGRFASAQDKGFSVRCLRD